MLFPRSATAVALTRKRLSAARQRLREGDTNFREITYLEALHSMFSWLTDGRAAGGVERKKKKLIRLELRREVAATVIGITWRTRRTDWVHRTRCLRHGHAHDHQVPKPSPKLNKQASFLGYRALYASSPATSPRANPDKNNDLWPETPLPQVSIDDGWGYLLLNGGFNPRSPKPPPHRPANGTQVGPGPQAATAPPPLRIEPMPAVNGHDFLVRPVLETPDVGLPLMDAEGESPVIASRWDMLDESQTPVGNGDATDKEKAQWPDPPIQQNGSTLPPQPLVVSGVDWLHLNAAPITLNRDSSVRMMSLEMPAPLAMEHIPPTTQPTRASPPAARVLVPRHSPNGFSGVDWRTVAHTLQPTPMQSTTPMQPNDVLLAERNRVLGSVYPQPNLAPVKPIPQSTPMRREEERELQPVVLPYTETSSLFFPAP